jgi:outer membrane protein assembly factor BamE
MSWGINSFAVSDDSGIIAARLFKWNPFVKKHTQQNLRISAVSMLLCSVMVLTACVYKLDIQQGNILEREKVAQLKPGMTKRQVRFILGTPLVIDTFNQDRWDYYYSIKNYSPDNREGTFHQERLILLFEKDRLIKIDNQLAADQQTPTDVPRRQKGPGPESMDTDE